jgi:tetratricopeptide (TPR) repeat protein
MDKTAADSVLPGLYAACGAKYLIIYQQQKAYEMFYTLIAEYPDHKLVSNAIASILANPYTCTIAGVLKDDPVLTSRDNLVPEILLSCAEHFSQTDNAQSAYDMYLDLFKDYPDFAQAHNIAESFQNNQYACNLAKQSVIPEYLKNINGLLPDIYYRCGKTYSTAKEYKDAIVILERFLNEYPQEPRLEEVRTLLAQAMIADARSAGAGTIDTPQQTGTTSTGKTMVQIQNDSPNRIRLVFTGPVTRIEELDACASCTTYSIIGTTYCPEKGPLGQYEMPTGSYDVLVESIGDDVTPFTGNWSLGGGNYYSCFFIVTSYK